MSSVNCADNISINGNHVYWKIGNISRIGTTLSTPFLYAGKRWIFVAFTNDIECCDMSREWLGMGLICIDDCHESFRFQLGIAVGHTREEIAVFESKPDGDGYFKLKRLIHYSEIESRMSSGEDLHLFFVMERSKNQEKREVGIQKFQRDINELLLIGSVSDVTIKIKSKQFKCHRCILGARSPVFMAMMNLDMKERNSGIINIDDTDPDAFGDFLTYLYSGSEENIVWKNVPDLYRLADKYVVEDLKKISVEYMKDNISVENVFDFLVVSHQYHELELIDEVIHFFVQNSEEIIRTEMWLAFLSERPVESNILIKALARRLR